MKTILDDQTYNPECAVRYFGFWAVEPVWACHAMESIKAGTFITTSTSAAEQTGRTLYTRDADGVAVVTIEGPMQKFDSKFGGTNTLRTRQAVRTAAKDPDTRGIFLHIDESPGGTVSGTAELAADIRAAGGQKPLVAHITDMGASAAYWAASQASRVTANAQAEVGSIGGLAVIEDSSKRAEMEGITVHAVTSPKDSAFKGMGADGTEVTAAHLAQIQERVDDLVGPFFQSVADGRGMPLDRVMGLADGRVWIASKAQAHGLLDGISTVDDRID
jgi:signal peptide peptidase SppA